MSGYLAKHCCDVYCFVCFNETATTKFYTDLPTLSLHDALPISDRRRLYTAPDRRDGRAVEGARLESVYTAKPYRGFESLRSEEHTSELQSLMRISYAVFCLKKK